MSDRNAAISRSTAETEIELTLDLDGNGDATVDTGIGFFDHMVASFAKHGLFDLTVRVDGDLEVDDHHTIEDVGIALGSAIDTALDDRRGIQRFADRRIPLDEAVASVVIDLSGRPLCAFEGSFSQEQVGEMTSQLAAHWLRSVAMNGEFTVHADVTGENAHHEIEALFKCVARTLDDATRIDDRRSDTPSTKGAL